jgi:hypothetical protein
MSGILGSILGALGERDGQPSAVAGVLQQVLSQNGGGVGLGDQAQSWVSTTPNQPISSEHIDQVFRQDEISGWAAQAGTSPDKMREVLAEALPHAVKLEVLKVVYDRIAAFETTVLARLDQTERSLNERLERGETLLRSVGDQTPWHP